MKTKSKKGQVVKFKGSGEEMELSLVELRVLKLVILAVDHPQRRKIIGLLQDNPSMYVTKIYKRLRLEQAVVSAHLAKLFKAGICTREKIGKFVYYSLSIEKLEDIKILVDSFTAKYKKTPKKRK